MPESVLSFASSSSFRNLLIARNLAPYQVEGVYTPPSGNILYEISPLNDSNVIFYDGLYDENATCHFALGAAYSSNIPASAGLTDDECMKLGINIFKMYNPT